MEIDKKFAEGKPIIGIVGGARGEAHMIRAALSTHEKFREINVVVISSESTSPILKAVPIINIEGELYIDTHNTAHRGTHLNNVVAMALAMAAFDPSFKPRRRPDVDLVFEYRLILNKKSQLSRSNRDWVVREFKSRFKRVNIEDNEQ